MSDGDSNANLYWSCPAGLTNDWRGRIGEWQRSSAVSWLRVEVQDENLRLIDDQGRQITLDLSRPRPSGVFAGSSGPKLLLGVVRVGQLLGISLVNESMEKINLVEIGPLLASAMFEAPHETLEDLAFAINLLPRAFRIRHLSAISTNELFF